ncbi:MAG: DUF308 domain-containing protein [Oscillospiraceae bacterium]|nr:DUF308 domain-containing protein [Oscillospiraceae bacterium]
MKKLQFSQSGASLVMAVLGVILLLMPGTALTTVVQIIGAFLLLAAAAKLIGAYRDRRSEFDSRVLIGNGLIGVIAGIFLLFRPAAVVSIFPMLAGLLVLIFGIINLMNALECRRIDASVSGAVLVMPIITIILGAVLFFNPFSAASTLVRVIGCILIYNGITGIIIDSKH